MLTTIQSDGLTMGDRLQRTGSFLPRGVAYAINKGRGLEMVTYAQLKQARIEKQSEHLRRITAVDWPVRRAGYLWTFYQPGLFGFAYAGWWAYLRTVEQEDVQLRWDRLHDDEVLALHCMELFPCGLFPIRDNFDLWKEEFGRIYCRPGRFKKQGLAPVWVTVNYRGFPQLQVEKAS
jgi:hypothetical protein